MVAYPRYEEPQRLIAAMTIEDRVVELARQAGIRVSDCGWNLGQGMDHPGPHRLDIHVGNRTVHVYFTDLELAAYRGTVKLYGTDIKLMRVIDRLQAALLRPALLRRRAPSQHH